MRLLILALVSLVGGVREERTPVFQGAPHVGDGGNQASRDQEEVVISLALGTLFQVVGIMENLLVLEDLTIRVQVMAVIAVTMNFLFVLLQTRVLSLVFEAVLGAAPRNDGVYLATRAGVTPTLGFRSFSYKGLQKCPTSIGGGGQV